MLNMTEIFGTKSQYALDHHLELRVYDSKPNLEV